MIHEQPSCVTDAKRRARSPHKPQKEGDQMPQSEKSEKKKKPTQKEKFSLIYKGVIALAAVVGILLQCEIGTSDFSLSSLRMFTTLSNLAVAAFFIIYVVMCMMGGARSISTKAVPEKSEAMSGKSAAREKTVGYFKFMITMSIMLTGLVAHFMLRKMFVNMEPEVKAGQARAKSKVAQCRV